jgi:hypothetical protein
MENTTEAGTTAKVRTVLLNRERPMPAFSSVHAVMKLSSDHLCGMAKPLTGTSVGLKATSVVETKG